MSDKKRLIFDIQKLQPNWKNLQNKTIEDLQRIYVKAQQESYKQQETTLEKQRQEQILSFLSKRELKKYNTDLTMWSFDQILQTVHHYEALIDQIEEIKLMFERYDKIRKLEDVTISENVRITKQDIEDIYLQLKKSVSNIPKNFEIQTDNLISYLLSEKEKTPT